MALSDDGNTLAIGAHYEDSSATGIDGDQANNSMPFAGAVYVFVRDDQNTWSQQAYVKASNTNRDDFFGSNVALSSDGSTLAVGVESEDSSARGIDGNQADESAFGAGAVYVFVRDEQHEWSQQAYVKASNTESEDGFGRSLALSDDGNTLAASAAHEASSSVGIGGDQADNSAEAAGAVYVFMRDSEDTWSQEAYIKASNTDPFDVFGEWLTLSGDGNTLAVSALGESSSATGIGGNQADNSAAYTGAVYVFVRGGQNTWTQQAYVKASNTRRGEFPDSFGEVALSGDGNTLAVGAAWESSGAVGIGGNQTDESAFAAGAVYLY